MRRNIFRALLIVALALTLLLSLSACVNKKGQGSKYEIAFESNGGTSYYSIRAVAGDYVILPVPEREGYEFVGWFDNSKLSGDALGEEYTIKSNATLYAKDLKDRYTVLWLYFDLFGYLYINGEI